MIAMLDRQLADEYIGQESGSDTSRCPSGWPWRLCHGTLLIRRCRPQRGSLLKWLLVRR